MKNYSQIIAGDYSGMTADWREVPTTRNGWTKWGTRKPMYNK
ncbi:hypothetical protein [Lederbergia lenta]|nr:hypothetical protein [Lederbergia lenta]MEC2324374.1 hypothetical protein [Lederbergia lenta]